MIVQNDGLNVLPSIQRALWNAYYGYAGHTTIHGWGSVICFPAPGRHYGAQSDWGFQLLLANSIPNTVSIHGQSLDSNDLRWMIDAALESICYSDLKIKLQKIKYVLDAEKLAVLKAHPNYREPVIND